MKNVYLVRYGLARNLGRFVAEGDLSASPYEFERGQEVVIRTHRGTELGEVVALAPTSLEASPSELAAPLLRVATDEDLALAATFEQRRTEHFDACQAIFASGAWPIDLIDAEPLLDTSRTVLHYLGPHRLDTSGLVAALRDLCGIDVVLEPVGRDAEETEEHAEDDVEAEAHADAGGCGSCGSDGGCGSCGSGGGCGSDGGCAVKSLIASRKVPPAAR